MINAILARMKRPEKGWDPVPKAHAASYSEGRWSTPTDEELIEHISTWAGGLERKTLLDLGGGPGQYSVAFAKRGANVTWHDISNFYLEIVSERARQSGTAIATSLGYMDEAPSILKKEFDIVFVRGAFHYGITDVTFAGVVYSLVKPGGLVFIDTPTENWRKDLQPVNVRFRALLNSRFSIKIGHPYPPHGRIAALMSKYPIEKIYADYTVPNRDFVTVVRASSRTT